MQSKNDHLSGDSRLVETTFFRHISKRLWWKKLNGIDLNVLDAEIAGCIHMYINHGTLEYRHLETLSNRLIDLNTIVLLLNREELVYFNRLRTLADLILEEVKR